MFKPSPLMKLALPKSALFGMVAGTRFMVTHCHLPDDDITVKFNYPGFQYPVENPDLVLDVAVHINMDHSIVAETPAELVYASGDLNKDQDAVIKIINGTLQRLGGNISMALSQDPKFMELSDDQKHVAVTEQVDAVTRATDKLKASRNKSAPQAEEVVASAAEAEPLPLEEADPVEEMKVPEVDVSAEELAEADQAEAKDEE